MADPDLTRNPNVAHNFILTLTLNTNRNLDPNLSGKQIPSSQWNPEPIHRDTRPLHYRYSTWSSFPTLNPNPDPNPNPIPELDSNLSGT